jgi:hypothetical protein
MELVGRDVSVDDIREYERRMAYSPMGKGRCLIINEAQDLSDSAVSLLLALVEKVNASKYDMIVFTAMVDVLELKNDPMNRWRALIGRCSHIELAETDSPVFRQEVVEYLKGVAAKECVFGVDILTLCEKAGWSIRAALNALDMRERGVVPVENNELSGANVAVKPKVEKPVSGEPTSVLDGTFISDALDLLQTKMRANGNDVGYAYQVRRRIETVLSDCGIDSFAGIRREAVENWIATQRQNGIRSARTINAYAKAMKSFSQYLAEIDVLPSNPLKAI